MSERGKNESLSDILEAIKRIQSYISGLDYEAFLKDFKTSDAVVRNLEVIGEAAKKTSMKNLGDRGQSIMMRASPGNE